MPRDLIPELHDVLKLTGVEQKCQDFSRWGAEPRSRTWQGVRRHHVFSEEWKPNDRETFVLHVADGVAASVSRHLNPHQLRSSLEDIGSPGRNEFARTMSGEARSGVQRLWGAVEAEASPLLGDQELGGLLDFLGTDPSFDEFSMRRLKGLSPGCETYGDLLRAHPEDKKLLSRITSLETHVKLVGKLYRQLFPVLPEPDNLPGLSGTGLTEAVRKVEEEFEVWAYRVKLHFNQQPFRTRDLTVVLRLQTVVEQLIEKFSDSVILAQPGELVMISPDPALIDRVREIAAGAGFWLEVIRCRQPLGDLRASTVASVAAGPKSHVDREPSGTGTEVLHIYSEVPSEITPPICEVCQSARAVHLWPRESARAFEEEREGPQDNLCVRCFAFREVETDAGVRLRQLGGWTELPTAEVLWTRVWLDYDSLVSVLGELYFRYMQACRTLVMPTRKKPLPDVRPEWAEVRFPLIAEFQAEYDRFLQDLNSRFESLFGVRRTERVLPGSYCFLVQSGYDPFSCLRTFAEAANTHFRGFSEAPLPQCGSQWFSVG